MPNEMIEIEKISFDISADELFRRILDVINHSNLWPKELDCENRSITADGNIKIKKTDEIIKKTAFGGKLGLFIVAPLSFFSRIIISDRIKIDIFQETADSSTMLIYLRIAKIINERVYSKEYDLDYEQLRESFMNSGYLPEEIENTIEKIYKKLEKKKRMRRFLSFPLLWLIFIVFGLAIMLATVLLGSRGYLGNWGGYIVAVYIFLGFILFIYKIIRLLGVKY